MGLSQWINDSVTRLEARKYWAALVLFGLTAVVVYLIVDLWLWLQSASFGDTGTAAGIASLAVQLLVVFGGVTLAFGLAYWSKARHYDGRSHVGFDIGLGSALCLLVAYPAADGSLTAGLLTVLLGIGGLIVGLIRIP